MSSHVDAALRNLQRLIERDPLLRDIVNPSLPEAKRQARFSPDVDVLETDEGYTLLLEVPGVPSGSLDVRVEGTKLIVKGEKPARRKGTTRVTERATGPFVREFLLPFQVAPAGIRARLSNGLLTVLVPRVNGADARSVPIEEA
jgi:HSP20 family protein